MKTRAEKQQTEQVFKQNLGQQDMISFNSNAALPHK